jgi:hypothetical protein
MGKKVILAGGSGFIGTMLARRFKEEGWAVTVLTRHPSLSRADGIEAVQWPSRPIVGSNPMSYETHGAWIQALDGADALVNLAGRSVNCLHTPENQRWILASRLDSIRVLGSALEQCRRPPQVWVQSSAVGYYGPRDLPVCDEQTPAGTDFLAGVCAKGEEVLAATCPASIRPVVLRLGLVLGPQGGVFPTLARLTRFFLGGAAGGGGQGISWIHQADLKEIFDRAIGCEAMRGTYNACAPGPVSNAEFMGTLRRILHRPWCPPAPAPVVSAVAKFVLRTNPALVLEGQFAAPARLLAEGFRFKYAQLPDALRNLAGRD